MTTIAITGVAGLIGRRLAAALSAREDVDRLLGFDVRMPTGLNANGVGFRNLDVRDPGLPSALAGVDVLVHLAFRMDPLRDEVEMRAQNVDGTRNVFQAAAAAGVEHVVYPSSVAVYGAHRDNDFPLTEQSLLRGTPGYNYSEHKCEIERWLWPWLEEHPDLGVSVLRFGLVAGPGVENYFSRIIEMPRLPAVRGHRPPLQFVHLDDTVAAILHAIDQRLPGAYNVCAEGWLSYDEVAAIAGRRILELPEEVAFAVFDRAWRLGLSEHPPGLVWHLMHPWVMSPAKLIETGWSPSRTNRDAIADLAGEHRSHVVLGRLRLRRSAVRAAALGAASAAGLAAITRLRRRRR